MPGGSFLITADSLTSAKKFIQVHCSVEIYFEKQVLKKKSNVQTLGDGEKKGITYSIINDLDAKSFFK